MKVSEYYVMNTEHGTFCCKWKFKSFEMPLTKKRKLMVVLMMIDFLTGSQWQDQCAEVDRKDDNLCILWPNRQTLGQTDQKTGHTLFPYIHYQSVFVFLPAIYVLSHSCSRSLTPYCCFPPWCLCVCVCRWGCLCVRALSKPWRCSLRSPERWCVRTVWENFTSCPGQSDQYVVFWEIINMCSLECPLNLTEHIENPVYNQLENVACWAG